MTGSTHPRVPRDFAIEVAENEGMPSRPSSKGSSPPAARTRRLTGKLTLGLSKTRAAMGGFWSAKEQAAMRHPLARLIAKTAVIAGVIGSFAFPVLAQDGTGPIPQDAQAPSYGDGCIAIDLPENAYLDRPGNRWNCNQGFRLSDGMCILAR